VIKLKKENEVDNLEVDSNSKGRSFTLYDVLGVVILIRVTTNVMFVLFFTFKSTNLIWC
jgi:hypothetical protein